MGEAALDAAESRQSLADRVGGYAEFVGHGDGGRGVGDIVQARHRQA